MKSYTEIHTSDQTLKAHRSLANELLSEKASAVMYCTALVLFTLSRVISYSYLAEWPIMSKMPDALLLLSMVCVVYKLILFDRYSNVRGLLIYGLIVIAGITYIASGSWLVFVLSLFVVGAADTHPLKMCSTAFAWIALLTAIVMTLSLIGAIDSKTSTTSSILSSIFGVGIRNSFGFAHVNYLGMLSISAYICRLIINNARFTPMETLSWVLCAIVLFFVVNTKTASCLILVGIIIQIIIRGKSKRVIFGSFFCISCFAAIAALYLAFNFNNANGLFDFLNRFLTGRLAFAHNFLESYPITAFGQHLFLVSTIDAAELGIRSQVLDNAFVHVLLHFGWLAFLGIMVSFLGLILLASRNGKVGVALSVSLLFIAGISETWLISMPGIIVLSQLLPMRDEIKQKSQNQ